MHPCRGAVRGGTKPVVSLTLDHRLQAWMPPASHSDAHVWFFCFHKMPSCRWICSSSRKCSLSPIRTRTTPLSRSNAHSTAFKFRPGPDTSGDRISEFMPLLYSHDPPKTARNQRIGNRGGSPRGRHGQPQKTRRLTPPGNLPPTSPSLAAPRELSSPQRIVLHPTARAVVMPAKPCFHPLS